MVSCIVPILNEKEDSLMEVLHSLTRGWSTDDLEVILVNDGSINDDGSPKPLESYDFPLRIKQYLRFVDNGSRYGVGYSFDRGFEVARGTILVLMGGDVIPQRSWLRDVKNAIKEDVIGSCCSVGLQPDNYDITKEGLYKRYGARILFTLTNEDLPKTSELKNIPNYRDILEAKWMPKLSDTPYAIPCPYGALYFLTRDFYQKIHGWDTEKGVRFKGHQAWGCLEPYLALKVQCYGGKIMMYPDILVGHIFGKFDRDNVPRAVRSDLKFYNKLWVAHTMLSDELRDEVINFPNHSYPFSMAQAMIRRNWEVVQATRQRNKSEGKLIERP